MLPMVLLIATTGVLAGCVRIDRNSAAGPFENRIYTNLTGFTKIEIGHAFQLEVVPSDNYSVSLFAGKNYLDKLDVRVQDDTLVFTVKQPWNFGLSFSQAPKAVITMPKL